MHYPSAYISQRALQVNQVIIRGYVQNGILAYCTVYTLPRLFKTSMWQFSKLNCQVNNKNVDFLKFRFVSKFLILNVHEIWIQIYFNISKYIKMHLVLLCFSGNKVKHNALWVQWSYTAHFGKCRSSRYSVPNFAQYTYCILQKTVREKRAILNIVTIWELEISRKHETAQNRRFPRTMTEGV